MDKLITALYCTDHSASQQIISICQNALTKALDGLPIISVSQKPIDFGVNVCVGSIGRSFKSYFIQLLKAVTLAETPYIAVVEHDCLYPIKYFGFIPPFENVVYYNVNMYTLCFLDSRYGLYSDVRNKFRPWSQIICHKDLLKKALLTRLENAKKYASDGESIRAMCKDEEKKKLFAEPGAYNDFIRKDRNSEHPTIDVLHNNNFTHRTNLSDRGIYSIDYWGTIKDVIKKWTDL